MATYEELRENYTENALSAALIAKGYSKEDIMKMEFAYKKAKGLIEYPEKKATISNFVKDYASGFSEGIKDKTTNYKTAIEEGFNESNVGMMTNKSVPEISSDFSLDEQVVKSISGIVSDAPVFAAGTLAGTTLGGFVGGMVGAEKGAAIGAAIGGSAGAFALEDGLRSLLVQYYKNGEATSFTDFINKFNDVEFLEVFQEGAKGAVVGAVLHGANVKAKDLKKWIIEKYGKDATKTKVYNTAVDTLVPTTALTASSSLLNREIPTVEDFIHAGMTIAGLHLITKSINPAVKKISEKTKDIAIKRKENKSQSINGEVVDIQEQGGQINPDYNGYKFTIDIDTKPSQYWTNYLMDMYVEYGLHPKEAVVSYRENPFSLFPEKQGQPYMIWSGEKLPVEYKVVEAKDLKTSHDAQGNRNKDYPEYMQNRERERKSSQEQINTIASNFMPELSIYGIEPQTGAPVITQDGFVISGNGRVEAIKLAKEKGTQGNYRAIAEEFDVNAKDMENPVIVRVLKGEYSEEQIRDLVQRGNQSTTLKLSKSETARDDATKLDDSLLDRLDTTTELSSIENRGFIDEALNKIIPQNEKASLLDKDGKITNEGINRINNALLANIIEDNSMLSKMIETEDVVLKKVSSGLAKSSPTISKMEKDIQNGLVNEDYSLVKDINEALNLYDKFKKSNMTFNEFMKQGDMFNEVSPSVAELTRIFQSSKGANVIKDIISDYSNIAIESSGGFNFDIPEMTKADILKEAYKRRVSKNSEIGVNIDNAVDITNFYKDLKGQNLETVKNNLIKDFEAILNQPLETGTPPFQVQLVDGKYVHVVENGKIMHPNQKRRKYGTLSVLEKVLSVAEKSDRDGTVDLNHNGKKTRDRKQNTVERYFYFEAPIMIKNEKGNPHYFIVEFAAEQIKGQDPNLLDLYNVRLKKGSPAQNNVPNATDESLSSGANITQENQNVKMFYIENIELTEKDLKGIKEKLTQPLNKEAVSLSIASRGSKGLGRGYTSKGESTNAQIARSEGLATADEIAKAIKEKTGVDVRKEDITSSQNVIEKHHTGKTYKETGFYDIEELDVEALNTAVKDRVKLAERDKIRKETIEELELDKLNNEELYKKYQEVYNDKYGSFESTQKTFNWSEKKTREYFEDLIVQEEVKYNEVKSDEFTDIMFGGSAENVKVGNLVQSDIYLGDKSQINVSFSRDGKAISRHQIADRFKQRIQNLAEVGNIPYRKNKMYVKGSIRGFYKINPEVIRTRGVDDLSVLVHETAHHLDKVLFKEGQTIPKEKESMFINELGKIASKGNPKEEGFAEFVSYFVTNPEFVQKNTPKFYKHFMEFMKENEPEILKILEETQKDYKAYREQSSNKRIEGQFAIDDYRGRTSFRQFLDNLYTDFVDDLYPLKVLEKEVQKIQKQRKPQKDVFLKPSESPYTLARLNRGINEKINSFLVERSMNTRLETTGKSLKELYEGLTNNEKLEFDTYLASKRAVYLNRRGIETGIGSKDALETIKNLSPKYEKRAQEVYKYIDNLRQYLLDSDMISEARVKKMKEIDPFYVPFKRVVNNADRAIARKISANQVVQRIKGSDRQLLPIQESLAEYTVRVIANADKNRIMQSIADLASFEGSGKFIERVPSKKPVMLPKGSMLVKENDGLLKSNTVELIDPDSGDSMGIWDISDDFWVKKPANKNIEITVLRDGEPVVYEVTPELAKLANGLNPQELGLFTKIASVPSKTLRVGVTLSPEFMIRNFLRDTMEAYINARKEGFIPLFDSLKGAKGIIKNSPEYQDWKAAGGKMASFVTTDRGKIQKVLKTTNKNVKLLDDTGYLGKAINTLDVANPVNMAKAVGELAEDSTRFGAYAKRYKYLKKKGYSDYDAKLGSAFSAREATIDFQRIGAKMRGLNAIIAFLNPAIQGADKMIRNMKNAPVTTASSLAMLLLAYTYFKLASKDDKDIEDLNKTIKQSNFIYRVKGGLRKIPIPQNAIPYIILYDSMLESANMKDFWDNSQKGFGHYMQINALGLIPNLFQPIVEGWRNRSNYTNVPLIPAWQEKLMPEYQYVDSTTETSKLASRQMAGLFGKTVSPILLDQAVRDWGGTLGMYALQLSDYALTGDVKQDIYEYEHTPFFRAFRIAYPARGNSQSYTEFMKASEDIEKKYNTAKYMKEKGKSSEYDKYLQAGIILDYRRRIIELGKIQKAISDNPNISTDKKRTETDKIIRIMINFSKQGNSLIDKFNKIIEE